MIVSKLIKELNKLPQDLNIKIVDTSGFKSDFNILNGSIQLPVRIVEYETVKTGYIDQNTPFLNDVGMMCDLIAMTKDNFLKKYFYVTSMQYEITKDIFYSNKKYYLQDLYDRMKEIDMDLLMEPLNKTTKILRFKFNFNSTISMENEYENTLIKDSITNIETITFTKYIKKNMNVTSKIFNMKGMFFGCLSLKTLDISMFDTSKVMNMSSMFSECISLESLNLPNFNTSQVNNMREMFSKCSSLTSLDVSNFDTSKVENMCGMFQS